MARGGDAPIPRNPSWTATARGWKAFPHPNPKSSPGTYRKAAVLSHTGGGGVGAAPVGTGHIFSQRLSPGVGMLQSVPSAPQNECAHRKGKPRNNTVTSKAGKNKSPVGNLPAPRVTGHQAFHRGADGRRAVLMLCSPQTEDALTSPTNTGNTLMRGFLLALHPGSSAQRTRDANGGAALCPQPITRGAGGTVWGLGGETEARRRGLEWTRAWGAGLPSQCALGLGLQPTGSPHIAHGIGTSAPSRHQRASGTRPRPPGWPQIPWERMGPLVATAPRRSEHPQNPN